MGFLTWRLSTFVNTFASREECQYTCVFTGELNVLVHAHRSELSICPSSLPVCAATGLQRDREHGQARIDPRFAERN